MNTADLREDIKAWVNDDPEREALMLEETGMAESTWKLIKSGTHNPGRLLAKAIRSTMEKHSLKRVKRAAV